MAKVERKSVLFLCTLNYERSRFAEIYFYSVAAKMGLPWSSISRGLSVNLRANRSDTISPVTLKGLAVTRILDQAACKRSPLQVSETEMTSAHKIVALCESEHRDMIVAKFPQFLDRVEFWEVRNLDIERELLQAEVMGLCSRLITGSPRLAAPELPKPAPTTGESAKPAPQKPKPGTVVKVGRETKGRRGKGVTLVSQIPLQGEALENLATQLKNQCGTGGTVKDGVIEIQGDQRDRITSILEKMGYTVKRVGG